jgi:type VI protein secretion system component VasK
MLGLDPRLVALLCLVFIGIGIFNIIQGRKRLRNEQAQGQRSVWYKQPGILTGIEYILLSFMFLLNIGITSHWFPSSLNSVIYPLYLLILFTSAIMAGVIIYISMQVARRRRAQATNQTISQETISTQKEIHSEASLQKRRERRKKAAAARRRRAGKA